MLFLVNIDDNCNAFDWILKDLFYRGFCDENHWKKSVKMTIGQRGVNKNAIYILL